MKKYILLIIDIIISFICMIILKNLNIIPLKYFLVVTFIMVILNILVFLSLFFKKKFLKIIAVVLSIIIVAISVVGIKYGQETSNFLNKAFNNNTKEITRYSLVVLKSNNYDSIKDLKDKKVGHLSNDELDAECQKKVNKKVEVSYEDYEDLYDLYDQLIAEKLDAILINEAYLDVLSEDYKELDETVKTIYSFSIEVEKEKNDDKISELKPINIYVSGSDSRSTDIRDKSRSDVNMIVTINPQTKEILMTSIPRDYYVQVHNQTGLKDKLTHSGIYGLDTTVKTVEDLFDIKIDYSIKIGFEAVVELVDLVDGIDVYSDKTFNSYHIKGWVVNKGVNHFNGKQALAYSRERYAYKSGDRHRIQNQQQVLEATLKKIMKDKTILLKYDELLTSLSKLYITDIPKDLISLFVKEQLSTMDTWTFDSIWVNGSNASLPTHTAPNSKRYVMIPYDEEVEEASNKIKNLLNKTL